MGPCPMPQSQFAMGSSSSVLLWPFPCIHLFVYFFVLVEACVASNSGGPGFKPRLLRCFLRQGPLLHFVSLHVRVPATYILSGGNPAMD